jgi:hypothetical protein
LDNPSLKRRPFRLQRLVNSSVTNLNWFLFRIKSSLALLAQSPCRKSFACLSDVKDTHYFLWSLFVQSLTAVPTEMLHAGSGPIKGRSGLAVSK